MHHQPKQDIGKASFEKDMLVDYHQKTVALADDVSRKYGTFDDKDFKKVTDISDRRRKILVEGKWYERVLKKAKIPFEVAGNIVQTLDQWGVEVPYLTRAKILFNAVKSNTKKEDGNMEKKKLKPVKWIQDRLKEKSTYTAIAALLALVFGVDVEAQTIEPIALAVVSIIVAIQAILKEQSPDGE